VETLTTVEQYNNYYGTIEPYIIEYPFSYKFQDEILQNVKITLKHISIYHRGAFIVRTPRWKQMTNGLTKLFYIMDSNLWISKSCL
jgi:hypothetical protein